MSSASLLERQVAILFTTSATGRLLRTNEPEPSGAPRLHLAIGAQGASVRLRHDVDDEVAGAVTALAAREPPVTTPHAAPRFAEEYRALLGAAPLTDHDFGVTYRLPQGTPWGGDVSLVQHGTAAGDALIAGIAARGMPQAVVDAGFVDLSHFWEPWCVALDGGEIASIAFAARLGAQAAEIGVTTMKPFRGRGFAAAATAGWSSLAALQNRSLFYATHRDNLSSQRVIARLDLPFLGIRMQL